MERGTSARSFGSANSWDIGVSLRPALLIVGVLAGGFLWVISVAPAAVGFALTAGVAAAWCAWLEKHPKRLRAPISHHRASLPPGQQGDSQ
jgi:hypothetical protein